MVFVPGMKFSELVLKVDASEDTENDVRDMTISPVEVEPNTTADPSLTTLSLFKPPRFAASPTPVPQVALPLPATVVTA
jgi:hypothetical protein